MTGELIPCPFCGSEKIRMLSQMGRFSAWCIKCDAEGPTDREQSNAVALWNRRATNFPLPVINPDMLEVVK